MKVNSTPRAQVSSLLAAAVACLGSARALAQDIAPTEAPATAAPAPAPAPAVTAPANETVVLRGEVKAKGSTTPLKDAVVIQSDNRDNNVTTDAAGRFEITLPKGATKLLFRAEGYDELEMSVSDGVLAESGPVALEPAAEVLRLGVIRARRKVEVSQQSLQRDELERIPGSGGDAVRGLQTLPSVIATNPGSAQITVRGSAPGDNRFFVDRLEVPFVFHLGGLGTVVPTRMLEGVDLFPGGWSSLYNDATGGIIQLRTENRIPERFSGQVELGLAQSSVYLEGNMFGTPPSADGGAVASSNASAPAQGDAEKSTARVDDRIGYRAGFRRTYLEVYTPIIKKFVDEERLSFTTFPQATDYQFVLNGNHASGTWQAYLLGAADRLSLAATTGLSSSEDGKSKFGLFNYFETAGARWQSNLGNGWGLTLAPQQRYLIIDQEFFGNTVDVRSNKFALEAALDKRFSSQVSATVGVRPEYERVTTDVDAIQFPAGGPNPFWDPDTAPRSKERRVRDTVSGAAYFDVLYRPVQPLTLNPGVSALRGNWAHQLEVDPRFSARYALSQNHALKAGWGYYSQRPEAVYDSKDYGNPDLKLERAIHYVGGIESKLGSSWETDFQVYYKNMLNFVGNATKEPEKKYENNVKGRSKGFEALIKKQRTGRWTGWVSYGYSKAERRDPKSGTWRPFDFDKPHSLNVVSAYKITGQWEVSSKWQYQSGSPTTIIRGGRFNQATGRYVPANITGDGTLEANDDRLPAYFQWDARTDYDILYDTWKLRLYLEVLNVTNRANVVGRRNSPDFSETQDVTGAPTIPTFGVIASF
ncbi:MAG: TonB-dependent receptor plug domain-containing protein [Silvanigrellales bacterium]|nr:TonB-dependent receptor plug domain-containing protein [Silvanigrellales bacterium]